MGMQENMAAVICAMKEASNLSLAEFAAELHVSRSALQEYMSGTGNPRIETVRHLAEKMGVEPEELLCGMDGPDRVRLLEHIVKTLGFIQKLPEDRQRRFGELLLEMVELWNE